MPKVRDEMWVQETLKHVAERGALIQSGWAANIADEFFVSLCRLQINECRALVDHVLRGGRGE